MTEGDTRLACTREESFMEGVILVLILVLLIVVILKA